MENKSKIHKIELLQEVAESNLEMFCNNFNNELLDYRVLKSGEFENLTDDQVRKLAVNFFIKALAKKLYEHQELYFNQV